MRLRPPCYLPDLTDLSLLDWGFPDFPDLTDLSLLDLGFPDFPDLSDLNLLERDLPDLAYLSLLDWDLPVALCGQVSLAPDHQERGLSQINH